ncbi:MAG: glycosyltransferase family 4 protein [Patescibacteria group bacterium]|nr:glycosyltransferase family 4 protein [Patescibacteria group bacterium]
MKIAHIVCTYPPYYGGMGNTAFQMASFLSLLGNEIEVFTPQYNFNEENIEERKDFASRLKSPIYYGNAAYLPSIKKELDKFDLIHLHYPFFGTANLVRKWKLKNPQKPLVITYHMDTRGDGLKGFVFKMYAKFWMPKILGVADKILVSSFDYIEHSDASKFFLANKNKFVELPFGVDINDFVPRPKNDELIVKHNLQKNLPTILFVGGMDIAHYFKGIDVLLKALYLLKENNFEVQTIFVGDGELKDKFILQAKGMGLENNVRFVGFVSNGELPLYYNLADLFILPSINTAEAFGVVLLEAIASGVPVIASNLPGVRTVAQDGGEVFTVKKYEELAVLIKDYFSKPENISIYKKQVREVAVAKYAWVNIVKKLNIIYKELVDKQ